MTAGRTKLSPEENDLKVNVAPGLRREKFLEVRFHRLNSLPSRETPATGETKDVGIYRESRNPEELRDDDRSCLVPYAGQRFQFFKRLGYSAVVFLTENLG